MERGRACVRRRARPSARSCAGASRHARALQALYRLEEAEAAFERAIAVAPSAELWTRLGQVYRDLGRYRDARAAFERALMLDPAYVSALTQLGIVALDLREPDRAIACSSSASWAAIRTRQRGELEHHVRAAAVPRLGARLGLLRTALEEPGQRGAPVPLPGVDRRRPARQDAARLYAEQGLGDEIMFASCYSDLAARGARLVLECAPKLARLFARSFPAATVFGRDQAAPADWLDGAPHIDLQAPCGTVASHLRRSAESFAPHAGYLRADPGRVADWRARLDALGPGAKIGISWRGGTTRTRRRLGRSPSPTGGRCSRCPARRS